MSAGGYRLAARLARREVRRRPGRTLLVALLVAMPVASMTIAAVVVRTEKRTPMERWTQDYGRADAVIYPGDVAPAGDVAALLARSRQVEYLRLDGLVRTTDRRRAFVSLTNLPMRDPITDGIMQVTSGRAPRATDEVFLTRNVARALEVRRGETLELDGAPKRSFTVVGVGEVASSWGGSYVVLDPRATFPKLRSVAGLSRETLVGLPDHGPVPDLSELAAGPDSVGWGLQFAPDLVAPPPSFDDNADVAVRWSWVVGAVVLTVVGIVIAAAFAAGARRQLVTLGQLAANGAPPSTLRRTLFLQGTWTGIVGTAIGFGLGAVVLWALTPHMDRLVQHDVDPYRVRPADLVPIALLGIVAATIAARVPARTTSRVPVLAALAGRRPLGRVPAWLPVSGVIAIVGGLALFGLAVLGARGGAETGGGGGEVWALTAIAGGIAVLLGACAIAPAYVSTLEPVATRMRGAWRLAARSLARQRTRTGAVVSAIAATAALAIAASSFVLAARAHDENDQWMRRDEVQLYAFDNQATAAMATVPPRLVREVARALPGAVRFDIRATRRDGAWSIGQVTPDDPADLRANEEAPLGFESVAIADDDVLHVADLSETDRARLDEYGALVFGPAQGTATLLLFDTRTADAAAPAESVTVGMADEADYPRVGPGAQLLATPRTAANLGFTQELASSIVFRAPDDLTEEQRVAVRDAEIDYGDASPFDGSGVSVAMYEPPNEIDPLLVDTILVTVALLLVLFVVAVNLALSAAETRDERDVLAVVGASPKTTRRTNAYKALVATALGTTLAVPVGYSPYAVFVAAEKTGLPLVFPWRVVSLLVIAVPVLAALATGAGSATALRLRPVRVSKMAFD
jgi:putative ABC transport system permease protein